MSRELVGVLWFEDVGFLHEQVLDTPVGRFSVRQMGFFLIFGLLAYITSLAFSDLALKVVFGGAVFFMGAVVALWKVRTLPLEVHLLYLIRRHFLQSKHAKDKTRHLSAVSSLGVVLSGSLGVPLRISGILKESVGRVLSDKTFNLTIDDKVYSKVATDGEGFFSTYVVPDHLGQVQIALIPENSHEPVQQIVVNVTPVKEEKETEKEEENKNAKEVKFEAKT